MSPTALRPVAAADTFGDDLDLSIVGLGVQYPEFHNGPDALEKIAKRHYPESNMYVFSLGDDPRAAILSNEPRAICTNHLQCSGISDLANLRANEA